MPMLDELRTRFSTPLDEFNNHYSSEESLVPDTRSGLKSKQIVEEKFGAALVQAASERMEQRFEARRSHLR